LIETKNQKISWKDISDKIKSSSNQTKEIESKKKYKYKINPKENNITYQYEKVKENNAIDVNLIIKNIGEDKLPKNCEIQLIIYLILISTLWIRVASIEKFSSAKHVWFLLSLYFIIS
jgi:hypothetical protein